MVHGMEKCFAPLVMEQFTEHVQYRAIDIIMEDWPLEGGLQEWQEIHVPEVVSSVAESELQKIQRHIEARATNSVLENLRHARDGSSEKQGVRQQYHCLKTKMLKVLEHEHWLVNLHMQKAVEEFVDGLNGASDAELSEMNGSILGELDPGILRLAGNPNGALPEASLDLTPLTESKRTEQSKLYRGLASGSSTGPMHQELASMVQHINNPIKQLENYSCALDRIPGPVGDLIRWLERQKEPDRPGILARIVTSKRFESFCLMIIVVNLFFTFHETNSAMADQSLQKAWDMQMAEILFTAFYTFEIIAKIWVHRSYFFLCGDVRWNLLDFALVVLALIDLLVEQLMRSPGMTNAIFMRLLRLLRTAKIFRIVRLLRFFSELRLIMTCIVGSAGSLFWSVVMLTGFAVIVSIVLVQHLTAFLIDNSETVDPDNRRNIEQYFGSVQASTLSLFKAMGGGNDWDFYVKELEKTGPFNTAIFIAFMLFVWLSMANIITSLYVEKALKAAQPDVEELLFSKHKEDFAAASELKTMFNKMDVDGNGSLSREEFEKCMADFKISSYFEMRGLAIKDAEMFSKMLIAMGETDEIDIGSFVGGCLKMKGVAMNIDLVMLHYEVKLMHRAQRKQFDALQSELSILMEGITGHRSVARYNM